MFLSLCTGWLFRATSGHYYLNLPEDNWSEYGLLQTTWHKVRVSPPRKGQTQVTAYPSDSTYTTSNGQTSRAHNLRVMHWGVAADCAGSAQSQYSLSLMGTPFHLEDHQPAVWRGGAAEVGSGATCTNGQKTCSGSVGGGCGYCGFQAAHDAPQPVVLLVDDQLLFDAWAETYTPTPTITPSITATTVSMFATHCSKHYVCLC